MQKPIILVTGATGAQGGSVAYALLNSKRYTVRALTRNASSERAQALAAAGAEIVEGTLDNVEDLKKAMEGCNGVFGVTNFWEHYGGEMQHGRNLLDAVHQSDIQHFVFSTLPSYQKLSNGELSVPHCDIKGELEEYSRRLGLKATYMHIAFYYENFINFFPFQKQEDGKYHFGFPQGDTPLAMVSVDDFGPVVLAVFDRAEEFIGRVVGVVGEDEPCSKYAETMTEVLGAPVQYDYIPVNIYKTFPFPGAEELGNMFEVQRRFIHERKRDKEETYRLNPQTQSLKTWLEANKAKFALGEKAEAEAI